MSEFGDDIREMLGERTRRAVSAIARSGDEETRLAVAAERQAAVEDSRIAGAAAVPAAAILTLVVLATLAKWALAHPFLAAGAAVLIAATAFLVVRAFREEPRPDPGHDRHHDAVQVLKVLALANNRIDETDRDVIAAYMVLIPGNGLPPSICRDLASSDLPSPMDLDHHLDGALESLETSELDTLVEHVRLMRRSERRLTPVTREWYDRVERRLASGAKALRASSPALGQRIGGAFDPSQASIGPLERFDRHVAHLRDLPRDHSLDEAVDRAREPLVSLEAAEIDEDVESAIADLVDRQFAGVVASYAAARPIAEGRDVDRAVRLAAGAVDRIAAGLDELVSTQSGRAISRLDTVSRYVESRNPDSPFSPL